MSQSEDIDSINRFFLSTQPKTSKAVALKDDWIRWFQNLGFWEKSMDGSIYDLARNKRNDFNLANATTAAEKADVQQVMKTGLTTEQTSQPPPTSPAGGNLEEFRRTGSTGNYIVESPPLIPTAYKVGLIAVAAVGSVAFAYALPSALIGGGRMRIGEKIGRFRRKIARKIGGKS